MKTDKKSPNIDIKKQLENIQKLPPENMKEEALKLIERYRNMLTTKEKKVRFSELWMRKENILFRAMPAEQQLEKINNLPGFRELSPKPLAESLQEIFEGL